MEIREELERLADPKYRAFQSRLLPGVKQYIGVRLPVLRKFAKRLDVEDLPALGNSFEERMLKGMVISGAQLPYGDWCALIDAFLPEIDNWSVCDSFCAGLKFSPQERERYLPVALRYAADGREFFARYGIVVLLLYYIEENFMNAVFGALDQMTCREHYAEMAAAWCVASCYAVFPEETERYLERCALSDFSFRMALRKICELRSAGPRERALARRLGQLRR